MSIDQTGQTAGLGESLDRCCNPSPGKHKQQDGWRGAGAKYQPGRRPRDERSSQSPTVMEVMGRFPGSGCCIICIAVPGMRIAVPGICIAVPGICIAVPGIGAAIPPGIRIAVVGGIPIFMRMAVPGGIMPIAGPRFICTPAHRCNNNAS
jgi:hypothetical protein